MKTTLHTKLAICQRNKLCAHCKNTIYKGSYLVRISNTVHAYHPSCSILVVKSKQAKLRKTLAVLVKKINAAYDGKMSNAKEPEAARVVGKN